MRITARTLARTSAARPVWPSEVRCRVHDCGGATAASGRTSSAPRPAPLETGPCPRGSVGSPPPSATNDSQRLNPHRSRDSVVVSSIRRREHRSLNTPISTMWSELQPDLFSPQPEDLPQPFASGQSRVSSDKGPLAVPAPSQDQGATPRPASKYPIFIFLILHHLFSDG